MVTERLQYIYIYWSLAISGFQLQEKDNFDVGPLSSTECGISILRTAEPVMCRFSLIISLGFMEVS